MNALSPLDRLIRMDNMFDYPGDLVSDAREARKMIDTFDQVNDTIRNPEKARPRLSEILKEAAEITRDILVHAQNRTGRTGTRLNTVV